MVKRQSGTPEPDAIDLLADDHRRVQKLFKEFEKTDRADEEALRELVETACMELQLHSMLETEIFYPAIRTQVDESDDATVERLNAAVVEHDSIDELIAKLQDLDPDDAMYTAHFSVLAKHVKEHLREEEKEIFPLVRTLKTLDLVRIADEMRLRREELFAELEEGEAAEAESAEDGETTLGDTDLEDESEDAQEQIDISRIRH
jgi:iron-sulfur cluster repair protein YtfE (RIC family)